MKRPIVLLLLRVFVATGTCLPSRYLEPKGKVRFTEPLTSNDKLIHKQTRRLLEGIYEVRCLNRLIYYVMST
jgi:hypothetical protein